MEQIILAGGTEVGANAVRERVVPESSDAAPHVVDISIGMNPLNGVHEATDHVCSLVIDVVEGPTCRVEELIRCFVSFRVKAYAHDVMENITW